MPSLFPNRPRNPNQQLAGLQLRAPRTLAPAGRRAPSSPPASRLSGSAPDSAGSETDPRTEQSLRLPQPIHAQTLTLAHRAGWRRPNIRAGPAWLYRPGTPTGSPSMTRSPHGGFIGAQVQRRPGTPPAPIRLHTGLAYSPTDLSRQTHWPRPADHAHRPFHPGHAPAAASTPATPTLCWARPHTSGAAPTLIHRWPRPHTQVRPLPLWSYQDKSRYTLATPTHEGQAPTLATPTTPDSPHPPV